MKLTFQKGNAKLSKNIYTFNLLSGHSCPFANECLSKVDLDTGKLKDGKYTKFRCFSATAEAIYPKVLKARLNNFEVVRKLSKKELVTTLQQFLPKKAKIVRLHVSGDFFNQTYFDSWLEIANNNPDIIFYAYTKSLKFWVNRLGVIPTNFQLTASKGGKLDSLINEFDLKYAEVVFSIKEAEEKKLLIDHDDSLAISSNKPFALLLHGTQPANTEASKALSILRKNKETGYRKK